MGMISLLVEARFSSDYVQRRELMESLKVPTISEVKLIAGVPLSVIIFGECHEELKKDFGLEPYLDGPKGELWVSPSDLLIGKVALTPPLTQKHIQALTHQGILALGTEVEQKFLNEMRIERENAVQEREDYLNKMFAAQKEELIRELKAEEALKYGDQMLEMRIFFENKICQLLWECFEQVSRLEEQMRIEYDSLNCIWQARLEQEIKETTEKITNEFLEKLRNQEQLLVSIFTKQICTINIKKKCAIDFERTKCKEIIMQMKHRLHCQNISNLMYLLCKERRKCRGEKLEMENDCIEIVKKYKSTVNKKSRIIRNLTKLKNKKIKQLHVRERCLTEILRQFQKFIYFALKAAPTQGEFLLNINKLILFELDDYCLPKPKPPPPVKEVVQQVIDETCIEEYLEPQVSDEEEFGNSDALPAFYFNDKMYVREDFRDMISAGKEIEKTDSLWNPDVEELLNIFRQSISSKTKDTTSQQIKSRISSVHFPTEDLSPVSSSPRSSLSGEIQTILPEETPLGSPTNESPSSSLQLHQQAAQGTIWKSASMEFEEEKEIAKISLGETPVPQTKEKKIRRISLASTDRGSTISLDDELTVRPVMRATSMTQSRLTLARDSIIVRISSFERKSLQNLAKLAEQRSQASIVEKEKLAEASEEKEKSARASEEKENLESRQENEEEAGIKSVTSQQSLQTPATSDSKQTSKLLLANDSYELIKSTIGLVVSPKLSETTTSEATSQAKTKVDLNAPLPSSKSPNLRKGKQTPHKKAATSTLASPSTRRAVKVMGSRKSREHEKTIDEFTDERIKSLVDVMKQNPSLIRLFTPCFK